MVEFGRTKVAQKLFLLIVCVVGFMVPVGAAAVFVAASYAPMADPGLPAGFKPVGDLTLYYVGGG